MPALLAGLVVLAVFLIGVRIYAGASPKGLAKGFRLSAGTMLGAITLGLLMTGRLGFAILTASGAWYLLFGTSPPWVNSPQGGPSQSNRGSSNVPRTTAMSSAEALKVLGLEEGASTADIRAAHRRLIQQTHPDKGGTTYLAAKINEAKDVLLKRR